MKRNLSKAVGTMLLGVVLLAALAACGGSSGGSTPPTPTAPQSTATAVPTATATPKAPQPTATPTVATAPTTSPTGSSSNDLLAQGKLIFEKTAGGVGCAYCHGLDGKGNKTVGAPDIRGRTEAQVRQALATVDMMSFIKLSEEEITAVVAYLQYLVKQP